MVSSHWGGFWWFLVLCSWVCSKGGSFLLARGPLSVQLSLSLALFFFLAGCSNSYLYFGVLLFNVFDKITSHVPGNFQLSYVSPFFYAR